MRNRNLKQLIARYRGVPEADEYDSFKLENPQVLADTASELMANIPYSFGACAMMSASWASFLQDHYGIPAMVVAGDLKIEGTRVFKCKKNLPEVGTPGKLIPDAWDGHCWIEVDGFIGDMSIFRTAYAVVDPSKLKNYIIATFGHGRGTMICPYNKLPDGMKYIPKFVLKNSQIDGLIAGMRYQFER